MQKVLILGAGKIGSLITLLLLESGDYEVVLADMDFSGTDFKHVQSKHPQLKTKKLDITHKDDTDKFLKQENFNAMVSCLPYFLNIDAAKAAAKHKINYFDLTEDRRVTQTIKQLAHGVEHAFVPQCGLAPGLIGIIAHSLMRRFADIENVKMRVGALPAHSTHALQYALNWSVDGLINEYGNPCQALEDGKLVITQALDSLESLQIDGMQYEAFNTSGGLGSLAELNEGKVKEMNYKTIRYPGHCEKIRFLMQDLKLNQDRETLKRILIKSIPKAYQDVVVIYVSVSGNKNDDYIKEDFVKKVYPQTIADYHWSAIQVTTAAGLCSILDIVLNNPEKHYGLVHQEKFYLEDVLGNRFGVYFDKD